MFKNNKLNGKATLVHFDGRRYSGEFVNDSFQKGKFTDVDNV